jgi:GNAT superfamily N-acetyltransferase
MSVRDSVCIRKLEIPSQKREISRRILADLGEWFGIPEATESYIDKSSTLPFWAAFDGAAPVGFIVVLRHFDRAAEIYVMGVMKVYHRRGIGNLLLDEAETWCALEPPTTEVAGFLLHRPLPLLVLHGFHRRNFRQFLPYILMLNPVYNTQSFF